MPDAERICGDDIDEPSFIEWLHGTSVREISLRGKPVRVLSTRVDIQRKADASVSSANAHVRRRRHSSDNIFSFTGRLVESFGSSKEMSSRSEKSASPEASRNEPPDESTSCSAPVRHRRLFSWIVACFRGSSMTRSRDVILESPSSTTTLDRGVAAEAVRALAADALARDADGASDDARCDLHRWRACTRDYSITPSNSPAESSRSTPTT